MFLEQFLAGRWLRQALTVLVLSPAVASPGHGGSTPGQQDGYLFGVFPYLSAVRLEHIYAPVSARIGSEMGKPVHFRTASQFKRFFGRLKQQHYDLALIQPFWVVPAMDQFGYQPVVRMGEPFTSLIMVLDDSPLRRVQDLRGKVIATPPAVVPVVHMAKKALRDLGLEPGQDLTLRAFKSVDSCFQQVIIGNADACVAPPFAPPVVEERMQVKLRTLLTTPAIPNLTLMVHQRVPAADREHLRRVMLELKTGEAGIALLKGIKTHGFVPAAASDYAPVRVLLKELQAP